MSIERRFPAAELVALLTLAGAAGAELVLPDPESDVYYRYAVAAGDRVQVEKDVVITGDLHSNGDVDLKKDSSVLGDVTAVGSVDLRGAVSGAVSEGAPPVELPAILDEASLRALADRVFEQNVTFTDETIDDVVFVDGTARIRGDVRGTGAVIATGDVRLDTTGGGGFAPLDPGTRLSLIAGNDIRLGKDRPFRGVLRAGRDVDIEMGVVFEGVAVADRTVHVKQGARVTFVDFDATAPEITLISPADGAFLSTATPEVVVAYSDDLSGLRPDSVLLVLDGVDVTADADVGPEGLTFTPAPLPDGLHTLEVAVADRSGNEARETFTFTTDTEPPTITLSAPDTITLERGGTATATVEDDTAVAEVVFRLDGVELARLSAPPFEVDFEAPEGAQAGDVLVLTVEASDTAGNVATLSREVRVAAGGIVVGQVLSDETGHPLAGARVWALGHEERVAVTGAEGRYSLPALEPQVVLSIESADGSTLPVERSIDVLPEVGTVAVDARLRPLAAPVTVGAGGGTVEAEGVSLAVPSGAVAADTPVRLTPLGPQGLPSLLPLGWSPLAAFDVQGPEGFQVPVEATVDGLPPEVLHLARYRRTDHLWVMVEPDVVVSGGAAVVALPEPGSYALLALDGDVPVDFPPPAGGALPGVAAEPLPPGAVCEGEVDPPVLPPGGGTARGLLSLLASSPLPSGTVVRTEVTETFTLASGTEGSSEVRSQDVIFYRLPAPAGAALGAEIPVVPVRTFETGELVEARVHVEVLSGRVTARGRVGGQVPVAVESGSAALAVAADSLAEDTAVSIEGVELSTFVPVANGLVPLAEVVVDFSGRRLALPAELSVDGFASAPEDSFLVARVERVDGVPLVTAVATAELAGGRVVTVPHADLPGIIEGGRYVVFRSSAPYGLVSGVTSSDAGPVRAVVESDAWPLAAVAGTDGRYTLAVRSGPATLSARVPGTNLRGTANVEVVAGQTVEADLHLAGTVTTATVTPADGATGVTPSVQVEIVASVALARASVTAENVRLFQGPPADGLEVAVRLVLSASGRSLSVIPDERLEPATEYTLVNAGLADVHGGLVAVPTVTFTTAAEEPPEVDTDELALTFPDENGLVRLQAPPGTLAPGTTILIVNDGNGVAVSFTVGNDGSVDGEIPASIDDVLQITLVDPDGNVVRLTRSRFVAPDGRTAIGPGGGIVEGPGGTELRIPAGALDEGAVFQVEPFGPDVFPERPDLPGGVFGGGLRLTAPPDLRMNEPGDLVFPKPPEAPDGAFYYVYRRLTGPEGQEVLFEVIDHAFVEGEGEEARVATASYPFIGVEDSVASWEAAADNQIIGFGVAAQTTFFLMYSFDALLSGLPIPGLITGNTTQAVFRPGTPEPVFEPLEDVPVWSSDVFSNTIARSNADGRYALWDVTYRGGPVEVEASGPGGVRVLTAFEADPDTTRDQKLPVQYRNIAIANFAFPAEAPPEQVSSFETLVMKLDAEGRREIAGGIVVAGTPLIVGFRYTGSSTSRPTIQSATIQGEPIGVRQDTEDGPLRVDFVLDRSYTPSAAGRYRISAVALPPLGGAPITVEHTFLAVAAGGSNREAIPGPPDVITDLLAPADGSFGVPVDVLPNVVFTEPVKHLPANVRFVDGDEQAVAVHLSGIGVDAEGGPEVFEDLEAETALTSLTVRPLSTLRYGTAYRLVLDDGIVDLDETPEGEPDPQPLADAPRTFSFETFGPEVLGRTDFFPGWGVVAFGERSYVAAEGTGRGWIVVFDISDPASPVELSRAALTGRAMDVDGQEDSTATGERLVVAGAGPNLVTKGPSNLFLFDASSDVLERVGVVSLTQGMEEGTILRVVVKGRHAYVVTFRTTTGAAVDIVDLVRAQELHEAALRAGRNIGSEMVSPGVGIGQQAIVGTIPVRVTGSAGFGHLFGIAAGDLLFQGVSQTMVVAVGTSPPVAVVDPLGVRTVFAEPVVESAAGALFRGFAVAMGTFGNRPMAVVVGTGRGLDADGVPAEGPVLAVLDLTDPALPALVSSTLLEGQPRDVALHDHLALVGTDDKVILVALDDPENPVIAGEIAGIGGRLSVTDEGLVVGASSAASTGGLRLAPIGVAPVLRQEEPAFIALHCEEEEVENIQDIRLQAVMVPRSHPVESASLQLFADGQPFGAAIPLNMTQGEAPHVIPRGSRFPAGKLITGVVSVVSRGQRLDSVPRLLDLARIELRVDRNNDTWVDGRDRREVCDLEDPWAFWTPDPETEATSTDLLTDRATIQVRTESPWPLDTPIYLSMADADFHLQVKTGEEKDYLSTREEAEFQLLVPIWSPDDDGIPIEELEKVENEFLFWCEDSCAAPQLELRYFEPRDGEWRTLDLASVAIRDVKKWISAYSVREDSNSRKPGSKFLPRKGWEVLPEPDVASELTLLVHGYNVNEEDAEKKTFPRLFKRLYWTEHPVLKNQCDDDDRCAHTVALEWPGDEIRGIPFPLVNTRTYYYPSDEFNAFQSGVPLADFLTEDLEGRNIKILAHSAGNIVVNSAISLIPSDTVKTFIMYDAAIPSEVFFADYDYSLVEEIALGFRAAERGYPDDAKWIQQWEDNEKFVKQQWVLRSRRNENLNPDVKYDFRWRQPQAATGRGPWLGRFKDNVNRTRIVNMYNPNDQVLQIGITRLRPFAPQFRSWQVAQTALKPHIGPLGILGSLGDGPIVMFWANLRDTSVEDEDKLWKEAIGNEDLEHRSPADRADLTRGWAELAYWFGALSAPAGSQVVPRLDNISLEEEGRASGLFLDTDTHSYLVNKELVDVWTGFEKATEAFRQ